ncbi:MAG: hypothetical protein JWN78_3111 [Bacteroidota bacterium]|nr:hypothetical protein [Bacteroidota bacterium]
MKNQVIDKSTLKFLKELSASNNRDWFNTHKTTYQDALQNMSMFVDGLIIEMNKHDQIENASGKQSLYRIYNDVRFSKDKSPYNPRFAFSLRRATRHRRGGYYMSIKPGNSYLACGFFSPNPEDLKRIREDISYNYDTWKKILNSKVIKNNFGGLQGETLASAPRGFQKDDPAIELLRHKQFILRHDFKDSEVVSENFLKQVNGIFKAVKIYFDYMSEVLTTNANGELII